MSDIPPEATEAAERVFTGGGDVEAMLAAAAPHLARAERERCADLLTTGMPLMFLRRHGLLPGAGCGQILAAAAEAIRGAADG